MSRTILSDLLRNDLGFEGIIVTDALRMAGISDYFDPVQAVVETFRAGADLALMPFHIDRPAHITDFKMFIKQVAKGLQASDYDMAEMSAALERISNVRMGMQVTERPLAEAITHAQSIIGNQKHKQLEWQLANRSITVLHNNAVLPLHNDVVTDIEIIVDDHVQSDLLKEALLKYWSLTNDGLVNITTAYWQDVSPDILVQNQNAVRLVVVDYGYRSGVLDNESDRIQLPPEEKSERLTSLLQAATPDDKIVLIAMQSPYDLIDYIDQASAAVATYHSVIIRDPETGVQKGISFDATAAMLTGVSRHYGIIPVTLKHGPDYKNKE